MLLCDKRKMQKVYHRGLSGRAPIFLPGKEEKSSNESEEPPNKQLSPSCWDYEHWRLDSSSEEGFHLLEHMHLFELSGEEVPCNPLAKSSPLVNTLPGVSYRNESRIVKLTRYRAKKTIRKWNHIVSYACRKIVADGRYRINGRFVKKQQQLQYYQNIQQLVNLD